MKKIKKKYNNTLEIEPQKPTFLLCGVNVVKIVKLLFDPEQSSYSTYVIEDASGEWLIEEDEDAMPFSPLPLHSNTIAASFVFILFKNLDFDREATLREFKAWDITKVSLAPYYDRIIPMEDFLNVALKHFVGKGKDYAPVSL